MSANGKLWLVALSAALVGVLLGAGAIWATQQSATAALRAQIIMADAKTQAALEKSEEAAAELEALKTTSSGPETSAAATPTTPPVTKKPSKASKQFTFITAIDESGSTPLIVADYAQMLTGDAAAAAATAAGDESPPPNDYYIVNVNKLLRKLKVKPGLNVKVATNEDGTSDPDGHSVAFADWAADYAAPTAENASLREAPYWIWVKDGTIVKIEQQYLP